MKKLIAVAVVYSFLNLGYDHAKGPTFELPSAEGQSLTACGLVLAATAVGLWFVIRVYKNCDAPKKRCVVLYKQSPDERDWFPVQNGTNIMVIGPNLQGAMAFPCFVVLIGNDPKAVYKVEEQPLPYGTQFQEPYGFDWTPVALAGLR